jgi:hypothetical protein
MARLVRLFRVRFYGLAALFVLAGSNAPSSWGEEEANHIVWRTGYRAALARAKVDQTFALIWFFDPQAIEQNDQFAATILGDPRVKARLADFALAKVPLDAAVVGSDDKESSVVLLDHPAFAEMLHSPGLAMIDMRDETSPHFHHVVSVYPFVRQPISCEGLLALLDLPSGSLTQRTLIWAVRTHEEGPQSAAECSSLLAAEAERHSRHQASINLQGHHNWDQRFQDINGKLGDGMISREVCAESWPGQRLVEAAEECVHSWRKSSGHWEVVSGQHACFGYDMKFGSGGVWYATGIFGDRR